ncbi:hypothetical protein MN116_006694 [Schistosoma mekongi]|uniref:Leucine-rich repeat-containing protein n=1 Tax=Schistosoma mekongi TaxID=38744 RepID=A0AAE1Z8L0_SCHME|nr:hypothetical protein MN116_006694 [Schistosoma mekongi]
MDIICYGFRNNQQQYKLTNSLNIADNKNLQVIQQCINEGNYYQYDCTTRLLLINVSTLDNQNYAINENNRINEEYKENVIYYEKQLQCSCLSHIKSSIHLQNELIYPEFIVEVEYILKTNEYNTIINELNINSNDEVNNNFHVFDKEIQADQQWITTTSSLSLVSNAAVDDNDQFIDLNQILNNDSNLSQNSFNWLHNETTLILNNLNIFKNIQFLNFSNLNYLCITHCQLIELPQLQCDNLSYLIINHNQLTSLHSLNYMPNLKEFHVDYNQLTCIIENISILQLSTPKLQILSVIGNPWINDKLLHIYTLCKLPQLKLFNLQLIHSDDILLANELLNSSLNHIHNYTTLSNYNNEFIQFNNEFEHNLTILPIAYYHLLLLNKTNIKILNNNLQFITSLCLHSINLLKIEHLENLSNLNYLSLNHNFIEKIEGLTNCLNLIELSIEYNLIQCIDNIQHLTKLQCLLLSNNKITIINELQFKSLNNLHILSLRNNQLEQINDIEYCKQLTELYLGNNQLKDIKIILNLKKLPNLHILELTGNNILIQSINHYRYQIIYYLKSIKYLDGNEITINELNQSNELFNGHLTYEYLIEYLQINNFNNLVNLTLSKCMLKSIDYINPYNLVNLRSINLEKNLLTSFGYLVFLTNLKVICLNDNNIESLFSKEIITLSMHNNLHKLTTYELQLINLYQSKQLIYPNLNVLHLAKNNLHSLHTLQLYRMTSIEVLFLQDNELIHIHELDNLNNLKALIIDNNKIKLINELCFLYNWTLQEIHLENNYLTELNYLNKLENLRYLYVGGNKLNNYVDLENFAKNQKNLIEISLIHNPITIKQIHRLILIYFSTNIQIIDGIQVTNNERYNIRQFYEEKQFIDVLRNNTNLITTYKVNNYNDDYILPELSIKKSLMCPNIKFHNSMQSTMLHNLKEYQTLFISDNNNFNDDQMNKTKLNIYSRQNYLNQLDNNNNEKNALTIKSMHSTNNLIHNNYRHYVKQQYQCLIPISKSQLMHSYTRPHSRISKVGQLKSFKSNNSNNNNNTTTTTITTTTTTTTTTTNNNNNNNNSLTASIITTHVNNNSGRSNTNNSKNISWSLYQRLYHTLKRSAN